MPVGARVGREQLGPDLATDPVDPREARSAAAAGGSGARPAASLAGRSRKPRTLEADAAVPDDAEHRDAEQRARAASGRGARRAPSPRRSSSARRTSATGCSSASRTTAEAAPQGRRVGDDHESVGHALARDACLRGRASRSARLASRRAARRCRGGRGAPHLAAEERALAPLDGDAGIVADPSRSDR